VPGGLCGAGRGQARRPGAWRHELRGVAPPKPLSWGCESKATVIAGLVPAIPLMWARCVPKRDARVKPAHDSRIFPRAFQIQILKQPRIYVLAAGAPARVWFCVSVRAPQKREARLCSRKRERSAVRRGGRERAVRGTPTGLRTGLAVTALHCGVIRWWDPSASPDVPGLLSPDIDPATRRKIPSGAP